jgi:hypothetical protein
MVKEPNWSDIVLPPAFKQQHRAHKPFPPEFLQAWYSMDTFEISRSPFRQLVRELVIDLSTVYHEIRLAKNNYDTLALLDCLLIFPSLSSLQIYEPKIGSSTTPALMLDLIRKLQCLSFDPDLTGKQKAPHSN